MKKTDRKRATWDIFVTVRFWTKVYASGFDPTSLERVGGPKRKSLMKVDAESVLTTLFTVLCSALIEDAASLDYVPLHILVATCCDVAMFMTRS
ncbi:hypothetical protein OROGR_015596 [Orobanche gracilis]